jgi:hypothetical protein
MDAASASSPTKNGDVLAASVNCRMFQDRHISWRASPRLRTERFADRQRSNPRDPHRWRSRRRLNAIRHQHHHSWRARREHGHREAYRPLSRDASPKAIRLQVKQASSGPDIQISLYAVDTKFDDGGDLPGPSHFRGGR